MHPNPIFRGTENARVLDFLKTRGFGQLAVNGETGPVVAHAPFVLSDDGGVAYLHLMRSNPVARSPGAAVMSVMGPDGYISPDWYGLDDQVPTWNYVAAQMRGRLEILPDEALKGVLEKLSNSFEQRLAPKPPWRLEKLADEAYARMARMILPARLVIEDVESTYKLGQNKPDAARLGAASALPGGVGQELAALGEMMRDA